VVFRRSGKKRVLFTGQKVGKICCAYFNRNVRSWFSPPLFSAQS